MQKRVTNVCLALALVLLFSACGDRKMPQVKHNADPLWEAEFEDMNPEFVEDYIYLWDLLENEYPMLAAAERITGKDAQEVKERYYYAISDCKEPYQFFDLVQSCLYEFRGAGHLSVLTHGFYEEVYTRYSQSFEMLAPHSRYNYSQMTAEKALEFYRIDVEKAEAKLNRSKETGQTVDNGDNLRFSCFEEQSAGYVAVQKMRTFSSDDNSEYVSLLAFFEKLESEGYENCIIDIRHNGGGSDWYWMKGIVLPNLSEQPYWEEYALMKGEVCEKYYRLWTSNIFPADQLPAEELPRLQAEDLEEANYFIATGRGLPVGEGVTPLFTGRFWLLVNGIVYSSSESFSQFCKSTGFATLVGTNTGGDGGGIDPIVFALPNTGICIRFSAANGLNPDGSCNEEVGTAPDYYINGEEDALEKCLALIANQA